ncbi:MAG TPA: RDD family protein [Mucilaginibacter sp.]|jgi:uncharacterized RDD family membrane protein YckC|nr:RDD family protein [Mucilaginibacter sp.]
MPADYLLVVNGKPEGPFSIEQLKQQGINQADFVKSGDMDDYKQAHEVAELRGLFGFKAQAVVPQYFGSFDQRLVAWALDWFFVSLVCLPIIFALALLISNQEFRIVLIISLSAIIPVANLFYHIVMECSPKQATYGKQIIKLKVCDMEGRQISFGRSAGRNLAKLISGTIFYAGYWICFFTKQQQCLHDMMAGTLVMKDRLF